MLKVEDLEFRFCWHCMAKYAVCPDCGANSCSAFCQDKDDQISQDEKPCKKSGFWELEWERNKTPTKEQVIKRYNWLLNLTKEDLEDDIKWMLGNRVDEELYIITKFAKQYNVETVSFEEFCKLKDVCLEEKCKTVEHWIEETKNDARAMQISSERIDLVREFFGDTKIPWIEFVEKVYYDH